MSKKKYIPLPKINPSFIKKQGYFLLFETSLFDKDNYHSYILSSPCNIIKAKSYDEIVPAFARIDSYAKKKFLAGYFSYELGYFFENDKARKSSKFPLINLGVFDEVSVFNHKTGRLNKGNKELFSQGGEGDSFSFSKTGFSFTENEYASKVLRIKEYIRQGDTYQVNFTGRYNFKFLGSAWAFYQELKRQQPVGYSSFCKLGDEYLISLSP